MFYILFLMLLDLCISMIWIFKFTTMQIHSASQIRYQFINLLFMLLSALHLCTFLGIHQWPQQCCEGCVPQKVQICNRVYKCGTFTKFIKKLQPDIASFCWGILAEILKWILDNDKLSSVLTDKIDQVSIQSNRFIYPTNITLATLNLNLDKPNFPT